MQNNDQHRAAHTSVWILKNGEREKNLHAKQSLKSRKHVLKRLMHAPHLYNSTLQTAKRRNNGKLTNKMCILMSRFSVIHIQTPPRGNARQFRANSK